MATDPRSVHAGRLGRWLWAGLLLLLGCVWASTAGAQASPTPAPSAAPAGAAPLEQVAPDSPRASMTQFFMLARANQWAAAARYLDVPPGKSGALLAEQLKAVLDRRLWIELEELSPLATGDTRDGLAPNVEELGKVQVRSGSFPVRLVRRAAQPDAIWVFTQTTLKHVPEAYASLDDRWLREHLPDALMQAGPKELLWWQWVALVPLWIAAWYAGHFLSWLSLRFVRHVNRRKGEPLEDALLVRSGPPGTLGFALLLVMFALPWLGLVPPAESFLLGLLKAGLLLAFFWLALRTIDVVVDRLLDHGSAKGSATVRSLVPLTSRIVKLLFWAIGLIAVLSALGYPVASLLAGLGIGGIALALAAQKTVENLFGSISISADSPFRVGDYVRFDGVEGDVEALGLRSTRIRTPDRTLITIPNGKLADLRIENFAARDRFRLRTVVGLTYDTSPDALRKILKELDDVLVAQPQLAPGHRMVRLANLGASALEIEVIAWFIASSAWDYYAIRERVLLAFMEVVEEAGASLAFPTQTLHLVHDEPAPAPGGKEPG